LYSNADLGKSSNIGGSHLPKGVREKDGSYLEHLEERSADFGEASHLDNYDKSNDQSYYKPKTPQPR